MKCLNLNPNCCSEVRSGYSIDGCWMKWVLKEKVLLSDKINPSASLINA